MVIYDPVCLETCILIELIETTVHISYYPGIWPLSMTVKKGKFRISNQIFSSYYDSHIGVLRFQMTTSDLKATHRPCGWWLVKSLGTSFLKTPYECRMWYLTEFVLNTEDENWTQNTHIYDHFEVEVTPEKVKVTRGFYFLIKIELCIEMKFLRSDLPSSLSITKKNWDPSIMIPLLRSNQHQNLDHFWRKNGDFGKCYVLY